MWDRLTTVAPVTPASLAAPPVPRLRGATLGPLAGSGGSNALAGGGPVEPPPIGPPPRATDVFGGINRTGRPPAPEGTVVERKPIVRIGAGVRNFAEDFGTGLANDASTSPAINAFGQGLFGAMSSGRARTAAEAAAATAAEERAYDRGVAADERAYDRGRDAASDSRADRELDAKINSGYFEKSNSSRTYVDDDGNLTAEGVKEVYGFVNDEVDSLRDFYQQSGLVRRSNAGEIEKKIADYAAKYRQDLEDAMRAGKSPFEVPRPVDAAAAEAAAGGTPAPEAAAPGGEAAPVPRLTGTPAPPAAAPPAEAKPGGEAVAVPPAGYTGAGTKDSPYAGGSAPPPGLKTGQFWTDGVNIYEQE